MLAGEGSAPELYVVEDLAGRWKMVVMVVMELLVRLDDAAHEEQQKYKEGLWMAINLIHGHSFVHGDIQSPNVL